MAVQAAAWCCLALAPGHFVWIEAPQGKIAVGFGEPREWDGPLAPKIAQSTAWAVGLDGKRTELKLAPDAALKGHAAALPKRVAFRQAGAACDYGLVGKDKKRLLWYGATRMLGPSWEWPHRPDPAARAELLAKVDGHELVFRAYAGGQPQPDAAVKVFPPQGEKLELKTNARGEARLKLAAPGEYLAYVGHAVAEAGRRGTEDYASRMDYATVAATVSAGELSMLPPLPERITAFGAATLAGRHYILGGHVGTVHDHSNSNLAKSFAALDAAAPTQWRTIPNEFRAQSVALVAWRDRLVRIGGMVSRNQPGKPSDMVSLAEVASIVPGASAWTPLPALPQPRSSHDAIVVGDALYVLGGWNMGGGGSGGEFAADGLSLDLADPKAGWKAFPQPFRRRALGVAAAGGKLYAVGGIGEEDMDQEVDVLDLQTRQWSKGPKLPGAAVASFGPAALELGGRLVVSLGDGVNLRLSPDGKSWEPLPKTPSARYLHRLVADGPKSFLALGGASMKFGHVDFVERVELP